MTGAHLHEENNLYGVGLGDKFIEHRFYTIFFIFVTLLNKFIVFVWNIEKNRLAEIDFALRIKIICLINTQMTCNLTYIHNVFRRYF